MPKTNLLRYWLSEIVLPTTESNTLTKSLSRQENTLSSPTLISAGALSKDSSYFPELKELMEYVKANATNPNVKYAMQQTWAYAKDSNHPGFFRYGKDQKAMYEDVVFSYDKAAQKQNISIVIPTGTAIQNGRSSSLGDTFCRDGYHLDLKYGR